MILQWPSIGSDQSSRSDLDQNLRNDPMISSSNETNESLDPVHTMRKDLMMTKQAR